MDTEKCLKNTAVDNDIVDVTFEIEEEVYEQVKKICDDMGTTLEEVLVAFHSFCIIPENRSRVKEILGIENSGENET